MSKIVLIICFSIFLSGCSNLGRNTGWKYPNKPKLQKVEFEPVNNGFFITSKNATNLVNNIDELKVYIEKLEELVKVMEKNN